MNATLTPATAPDPDPTTVAADAPTPRQQAGAVGMISGGHFELYYQKRVIDAALWVNEPVNESVLSVAGDVSWDLLPAPSLLLSMVAIALAAINRENRRFEQ